MNESLKVLYIVCFSLAIVSFCTAIFLFLKFRIIEVIQDLNGTIEKRQIELMRERNEHAKNYGVGLLDVERGKTEKMDITDEIGTAVLQSAVNNSDFVIIKNIVLINTSECI